MRVTHKPRNLCVMGHLRANHVQLGSLYREPAKGLQILLSRTRAGPGRSVKEEQEEISPNHVQAIYGASVLVVSNFIQPPTQ